MKEKVLFVSEFHAGQEVTIEVVGSGKLSPSQYRKVKNGLCGVKGCDCPIHHAKGLGVKSNKVYSLDYISATEMGVFPDES